MESSILFLLVGISIYLIKIISKNQKETIRILEYPISGGITSTTIGLLEKNTLIPGLHFPIFGITIFGLVAGSLLYLAEKGHIFHQPGIQYFSTIILGLILACLFWGFTILYINIRKISHNSPGGNSGLFLVFILWGFIIVFGYAFPKRWFKQKK